MSHPQPALTHEKRENSTILASKPSRPAFPSPPPILMIQNWSRYRKFPFIFSNQYALCKRNISDPLSLSVCSRCKPSLPARAGPSKTPFVGSFVPFATQQKHKSQAPSGRRGTNTPPRSLGFYCPGDSRTAPRSGADKREVWWRRKPACRMDSSSSR